MKNEMNLYPDNDNTYDRPVDVEIAEYDNTTKEVVAWSFPEAMRLVVDLINEHGDDEERPVEVTSFSSVRGVTITINGADKAWGYLHLIGDPRVVNTQTVWTVLSFLSVNGVKLVTE